MRFHASLILLLAAVVCKASSTNGQRTDRGLYVDSKLVNSGYRVRTPNRPQRYSQTSLTNYWISLWLSNLLESSYDWVEYEGCRYRVGPNVATAEEAISDCAKVSDGHLVHMNIRTADDRLVLFRDLLGLSENVWIGLKDTDGIGTASPVWLDESPYVTERMTFEIPPTSRKLSIGAAISISYRNILFAPPASRYHYVCEDCTV